MSLMQSLSSQELVDKIGAMVLVLDCHGRIEMINTAGCELLGYPRRELIGKDWVEQCILPEDQQRIAILFTEIIRGKKKVDPSHRNTIIIRSGAERLISWHNTVLINPEGIIEGILSTGEDITEQAQAEKEIRQSEARYRHFLEHVPEGLFIFDSEGIILDVNLLACERLGYPRQELLGRNFSTIDFVIHSQNDFRKSLSKQETWPKTYQGTHQKKNGSFFPVEVKIDRFKNDTSSFQYIAVARDLSERLFQEKRLQDNKDLLQTIIDATPEIICVKDAQGRWLLANKCAVDMYGLKNIKYQRKTEAEILELNTHHKDVFKRCKETDILAWEAREPIRCDQYFWGIRDEKRVFDVFKVPLFHENGTPKALVVIGRDITKQKAVELRYKQLFEKSPLAYLSTSLSGEIIEVNQAVFDTFGYSSDELIGKKLADFLTEESRTVFIDHYGRFVNGEFLTGTDYQVIKADGEVSTVMVTPSLNYDDAGIPVNVHVVMLDVTRERRAEEQIRESEELYRLLFERAPVGFVHFDSNFKVLACNEYCCRLVESTREELIGFDLQQLRDERVLQALQKALSGKEGWWQGEYKATLIDKKLFLSIRTAPLHGAHGQIRGGMAIIVDRSAKRRAEVEKMLLMSAIGQATETVVITDTDGIIEYVNPAFEQITGFSAEEVVGRTPRILRSNYHDADFYKQMWRKLTNSQVWKGRIINRHKEGSLIEEDMTISPVRDQEGIITNYVAVKRDVTREIALEKQLHQAQKMEAIGTLAGGIAHDFNNILSAILGYADMVDRQLSDHELNRRDIGRITMAGKRGAELVKQILAFSSQKEADFKPVSLQNVLQDALKLLRSSLPATVRLRREIDKECGAVRADPIRMHQVVMNLCANAKQSMAGQQGELVVRLSEVGNNVPISKNLSGRDEPGNWLLLEVSDTGCGIPLEMRQRIFDPFFSTRKKEGGTGLGLSVVHGIVQNHGGEIVVADTEGGGTTFKIYLPVIKGEQLRKKTPLEQVTPLGGNESVMVVDDEPMLIDVMERMLTYLGYTVTGFTDSRKALQWFVENQDALDLVITDMTMPYLTGAELAQKIFAVCPSMPVIVCSGYSESLDADKAQEIGISRFIIKPVESRVLSEAVRLVLDQDKK